MTSLMHKPVTERLLAGLLGLTLSAGLTGCSNDEAEPDLEQTTDASDGESTEYVPASADGPAQNVPEPRLPAVATENNEEGAEATLAYFWEAAQFARLTGETRQLELVSSESCDFCTGFLQDWNGAYEDEEWAVPHGEVEYEISDSWFGYDEENSLPSADILFSMTDPAIDLYASNGELEQEGTGSVDPTDWLVVMLYDATAQRWEIEWIGLEELVDWE